jgi:hypothetical protein
VQNLAHVATSWLCARGATHLASDSRSSALIWIKNRLSALLDVIELSMVQMAEQAALDTWWRYLSADIQHRAPPQAGWRLKKEAVNTTAMLALAVKSSGM